MNEIPLPSDHEARRAELVAALRNVAEGQPDALRKVYTMTSAKLLGICLRICADRAAAEDVLQEVYLKIWQRAGQFDIGRASPITWLCTIARNSAIDWQRSSAGQALRTGALAQAAYEVPDDRPRADELMVAAQDGDRLQHCLGELEGPTQSCIRSAFFNGLTYAQLAASEDIPLGTMKSRVRRGLLRLKDCLADG